MIPVEVGEIVVDEPAKKDVLDWAIDQPVAKSISQQTLRNQTQLMSDKKD